MIVFSAPVGQYNDIIFLTPFYSALFNCSEFNKLLIRALHLKGFPRFNLYMLCNSSIFIWRNINCDSYFLFCNLFSNLLQCYSVHSNFTDLPHESVSKVHTIHNLQTVPLPCYISTMGNLRSIFLRTNTFCYHTQSKNCFDDIHEFERSLPLHLEPFSICICKLSTFVNKQKRSIVLYCPTFHITIAEMLCPIFM